MKALDRAIAVADGVGKLAASIGLRQNVVSNWKARGRVPPERCPDIELATGIRCEQLRPDLIWTRNEAGQVTGYHVPVCASNRH